MSNKYKLVKTSNGNVRLLKDGKEISQKNMTFPLKPAKDYWAMEIKYGNMIYEVPLLANGAFQKYQPFWSIDKDTLFFSSENYFFVPRDERTIFIFCNF